MQNVLEMSDEEVLAEAHKLRVAYGLKHTIRYNTERITTEHNESVAEHVFALCFLAEYFLEAEPIGPSLNREKVFSIFLFHDLPEVRHGDVSTYSKTKEHEERERAAAPEVFASLPEAIASTGHMLWQEYEEHTTPEAKFCYALDKLEPIFELLDPVNERSVKRLKITVEMHLSNKVRAIIDYPIMNRFLDVMTKDMRQRGVFWKS